MHQQTTHFHHLLPPISLGGFCEGIVIRLNHDNVGRGWVYPELPRSVHESGGDLQGGGGVATACEHYSGIVEWKG